MNARHTRCCPRVAKLLARCAALCWGAALVAPLACAQTFPAKPVRLIVPYPPGGIYDVLGRMIAEKLAPSLGQQVIVDNRGGAGGVIGTDLAAKAAPDGHTIVLGGVATFAIAPTLYAKLPYDPAKDFAPLTLVGSANHLLTVHPSVPAQSVRQLLALARSKPGLLTYGSGGNGALTHLAGALLGSMGGVTLVHIPYKGSGGSVPALLGGEIDLLLDSVFLMQPFVKAGKLRALAVTASERSPVMPDTPTIAQAGIAGYDVTNWFALYAPAAIPPRVQSRLNSDLVKLLRDPQTQFRLTSQGAEPAASTPEELVDFTRREAAKWAIAVKASGARVD